jgi:GNAT superfamily N-acetyltransferase
MDGIEIRSFVAEDRDWVVAQHADHYARAEGFDASFGVLVGGIVDDFLRSHDAEVECGCIACAGQRRLGSIFCVRVDAQTAKLRLFLMREETRGKGLGLRMLTNCMGYAKAKGYRKMQLWTHESHRAAGALYAKTGWRLTSSQKVVSFGQPLVEQHWEIVL